MPMNFNWSNESKNNPQQKVEEAKSQILSDMLAHADRVGHAQQLMSIIGAGAEIIALFAWIADSPIKAFATAVVLGILAISDIVYFISEQTSQNYEEQLNVLVSLSDHDEENEDGTGDGR